METEFQNEPWQTPERSKILRSGILYAIILAILYQAGGYLGALVGWHRRSTIREWVLATIIGFLIGCLLSLKRGNSGASIQTAARNGSTPVDGSTSVGVIQGSDQS